MLYRLRKGRAAEPNRCWHRQSGSAHGAQRVWARPLWDRLGWEIPGRGSPAVPGMLETILRTLDRRRETSASENPGAFAVLSMQEEQRSPLLREDAWLYSCWAEVQCGGQVTLHTSKPQRLQSKGEWPHFPPNKAPASFFLRSSLAPRDLASPPSTTPAAGLAGSACPCFAEGSLNHRPPQKPSALDGNHESCPPDLTVPGHLLMKDVPVSKEGLGPSHGTKKCIAELRQGLFSSCLWHRTSWVMNTFSVWVTFP